MSGGVVLRRILESFNNRWTLGFSSFGVLYYGYTTWDSKQSGRFYELQEDLTGKTYIVTGATSGIGMVIAEALAQRNARVIMACRNREKCVEIRRNIVLNSKNKQVFCRQCDLSDFDSIVTFVSKISKGKFELDRIDGVLHNAAVMQGERELNKDGIEQTVATNHLGTFLLSGLLLEKLQAQKIPVRMVYLNSNLISHKTELNFANFNEEVQNKQSTEEEKAILPKKWDGYNVYKRTKLAEAVFVRDLVDRLKDSNVSVTMTDPGRTKSNLSQQLDYNDFFLSRWINNFTSFLFGVRKTEKAIRPVLYALCDSAAEGTSGVFFDRERNEQPWAPVTDDLDVRKKLTTLSAMWTKFPERLAELHRQIGTSPEGPKEPPKAVESEGSAGGRGWRTLWLW